MDRHERTINLIKDELEQFFDEWGKGSTNKEAFLCGALIDSLAHERNNIEDLKAMIKEKDVLIESYAKMCTKLSGTIAKREETIAELVLSINYN